MLKLTTRGEPVGEFAWVVGRATRTPLTPDLRADAVLVVDSENSCVDFSGYVAVVSTLQQDALPALCGPVVAGINSLEHVQDGYILLVSRAAGTVNIVYRPDSQHNVLFITDRCNSNCLMCSQPPLDREDDGLSDVNQAILRLIDPAPEVLGITGGEPTLQRDRFLALLRSLAARFPDTRIHMLTNGRAFAWRKFAEEFVAARHPHMTLGIPLYSDVAPEHDYVVQCRSAFDQTVMGIHRLARHQQSLEIRVVLHAQTAGRVARIARFIYHNMPFVDHVALMGLEMMGYVRKNYELLWIDPTEYQDQLEEAVEFLSTRGINVSIYNHQLCLLRPSLWKFARQSISDYKNIYLDECAKCDVRHECGGLFKSAQRLHSPNIRPVTLTSG
jgi:His-Xaa-Ser system radical SAM maturase HxsC